MEIRGPSAAISTNPKIINLYVILLNTQIRNIFRHKLLEPLEALSQ